MADFSCGSPSPPRSAELRSSSYGPMIHLRLLSTPPHGDAVTFGYRPENACLEVTSALLIEYAFRRTRARLFGGFPSQQAGTLALPSAGIGYLFPWGEASLLAQGRGDGR